MSNYVSPEGIYTLTLSHISNVPDDHAAYEVNGEPENIYVPSFEEGLAALRYRIADYRARGWEPIKALYVDNTVDSNEPYITAIDELSDIPHQTLGEPQEASDLGPARKMAAPPPPPPEGGN